MKDTDQSRFIKWGIPGWMMILAFSGFTLLDILLSPSSSKNTLINTVNFIQGSVSLNTTASAVAVILIAAAGVPLGFFIYQMYFFIRWNSPYSRDGLFPPFIVGRWNDLDRTMDGIDQKDITGDDKWRNDWTEDQLYKSDHGWKWRYLENFFTEITQYMDTKLTGVSLYARYRYLLDLMHTLGAGLFGIYLGYLEYVFLKVKTDDISLSIISGTTIVSLVILLIFLDWEDKVKRKKSDQDHSKEFETTTIKHLFGKLFKHLGFKPVIPPKFMQISNPSISYLIFVFTVVFTGSPSPYTESANTDHFLFRFIILGLVIFAWVSFKINLEWKNFLFEIAIVAILETSAIYIGTHWMDILMDFKVEWWNIGWSILFFLITNTIFVKNRQTARDDLIAMQNYTMKRYFSNSIKPFAPPQQKVEAKRRTPKLKKLPKKVKSKKSR